MFRKTVKCTPAQRFVSSRFAEVKSVPLNDGSNVLKLILSHVSPDDLVKSALPVVGLDSVLSSGVPIGGDVSFAPSDPTNSLVVESTLESYFNNIENNSNNSVDNEV